MHRIISSVVICFAFFATEVSAVDLQTMTLEKYEKIQKIAKHSDIPLIAAIQEGNIKEVQTLLEQGADVNVKDGAENTALLVAVQKGNKEILQLLLEKGADVNIQTTNFWGGTALMIAAEHGNEDIVRLLLEQGAEVTGKSFYRETVLDCAKKTGNQKIISLLQSHGAK